MVKIVTLASTVWLFATYLYGQQPNQSVALTLSYSAPRTFATGSKSTVFDSHFQCGVDGSVLLEAYETYSEDSGSFILQLLTPSGNVVRFNATPPTGYAPFSAPLRYFASEKHVYALAIANRVDPMDSTKKLGFSRFILEYDYDGRYLKSIVLEPGDEPLSIAAFASGNILLVTQEKFTKKVSLILIDEHDSKVSEINLFDNDYLGMTQKKQGGLISDAALRLQQTLAVAQYLRYGETLLVVPTNTTLPILQINEHGVLRAVSLDLPQDSVVSSMLQSDGRNWFIEVGRTKDVNREPSGGGRSATITNHEILEFNAMDGKLVTKFAYAAGLYSLCHENGEFLFMTTRPEDGHLQVIKGTPSR